MRNFQWKTFLVHVCVCACACVYMHALKPLEMLAIIQVTEPYKDRGEGICGTKAYQAEPTNHIYISDSLSAPPPRQ